MGVCFFRLQREAPNHGGAIMGWCAHKLRTRALQALTKAVRPSLPLGEYLVPALGWATQREAARFIHACGGALAEAPAAAQRDDAAGAAVPPTAFVLDCKASDVQLTRESTAEEKNFASAGLHVLAQLRPDKG